MNHTPKFPMSTHSTHKISRSAEDASDPKAQNNSPEIRTPDSRKLRPATGKSLGLLLGSNSTGAELDTKGRSYTESAPTPVIAHSMQNIGNSNASSKSKS